MNTVHEQSVSGSLLPQPRIDGSLISRSDTRTVYCVSMIDNDDNTYLYRNSCGCYANGTKHGFHCLDGVCQCRDITGVNITMAGPKCVSGMLGQ